MMMLRVPCVGSGLRLAVGFLFILLLSLVDVHLVSSIHVFDVYRLVQFETISATGKQLFGSQKTSFTLQATTLSSEDLTRSVVIIPLGKLEATTFAGVAGRASALLVLLPDRQSALPRTLVEKWNSVERELIDKEVKIPVYFAFEDSILRDLYSDVENANLGIAYGSFASGLSVDTYTLAVTAAGEPAPIKEATVTNFQGWLPGAGGSNAAQGEGPPTIALVAHHDTFAVAPALAFGGDSNGSGVAALLELARLFSKLYSGLRTQGKYNILFVVTGGGVLNYAGAKNWLEAVDSRLLASIEFALCLDTIAGSGNELFFHISRPPTDPKLIHILEDFNATATQMGITFEIVHKKINVSNPVLSWEHEHFSRKRIVAATLSHQRIPAENLFSRSTILDNGANVNVSLLTRNIRFVAEALAKSIYGLHEREVEVFEGSLGVSDRFVSSWLRALTDSHRVELYGIDNALLTGLERVLKDYTTETTRSSTVQALEFLFYGDCVMQMSAHRVKSAWFDALLSVVILLYLGSLYIMLQVFFVYGTVRQTWQALHRLFVSSDVARKRPAYQ